MLDNEQAVNNDELESATSEEQAVENIEQESAPVEEPVAEEATEQTEEVEDSGFIPDSEMSEKVRKRINKLSFEKHQRERELLAEIEALKQNNQQAKPVNAEKPKMSDFDYDSEKYAEAVAEWKAEQIVNERLKQVQQNTVQPQVQKFQSTQQEYASKNSDYVELVKERHSAIPENSAIANYILGSESGVQIHHKLLDDFQLLQKIQQMPDYLQGAELARLESALGKKPTAKKSAAPKPMGELKPTGNTSGLDNCPLRKLGLA